MTGGLPEYQPGARAHHRHCCQPIIPRLCSKELPESRSHNLDVNNSECLSFFLHLQQHSEIRCSPSSKLPTAQGSMATWGQWLSWLSQGSGAGHLQTILLCGNRFLGGSGGSNTASAMTQNLPLPLTHCPKSFHRNNSSK